MERTLTLYLVGNTREEAMQGFYWDTEEIATEYRDENMPGASVYAVPATIHFTDMEDTCPTP